MSDQELDPKAKLLLQNYILGLVSLYGSIAIAVLGLIGWFVFSAIESKAKETASQAVADAIAEIDDVKKRVSAIDVSTAEAKGRALERISVSELEATRASSRAASQAREIESQMNALIEAIGKTSPDVARELQKYRVDLDTLRNEMKVEIKTRKVTVIDDNGAPMASLTVDGLDLHGKVRLRDKMNNERIVLYDDGVSAQVVLYGDGNSGPIVWNRNGTHRCDPAK